MQWNLNIGTASFKPFVEPVLPAMIQVPSMLYKLGLTEEAGTTLLSQLNEFSPPDA